MNREIKLRAWGKRNKEMHNTICSIDFTSRELVVVDGVSNDRYLLGFDDVELMQFTGLLDLNGEEIYEGDLVTGYIEHSGGYLRKNFPRKVKVICEVIFDRGKFKTVVKKPIQEHQYAYENGDYRTDYYSLKPMFKNATYYRPSDGKRVAGDGKTCEYIEIVGNVFKNIELLEGN